jgi:glucosamine--fructose-6-phosphate aminotransferase (isomerizing)
MCDTVSVVAGFDCSQTAKVAKEIQSTGRLKLTGEGSSRIFPAKNAIRKGLTWGLDLRITTEGSRQAAQYDLTQFAVFLASNSGRTKEVILLAKQLAAAGNPRRYGLTANQDTLLSKEVTQTWVLRCGWEQACAATKSVVEQAMFYQSILSHIGGRDMKRDLAGLDKKAKK